MSDLTYLSFAKATVERAVKTFAQSLAALLVADGTGVLNTAWQDRLSVAGMAALLSVLSSIASAPFGGTGPSLTNEVISPPAVDPEGGYGVVELVVGVLLVLILVVVLLRLV